MCVVMGNGLHWNDGSTLFGSFMLGCTAYVPAGPPSPYVQEYGQCGGIGWSGNTICASPFVCKESSPYDWQCL